MKFWRRPKTAEEEYFYREIIIHASRRLLLPAHRLDPAGWRHGPGPPALCAPPSGGGERAARRAPALQPHAAVVRGPPRPSRRGGLSAGAGSQSDAEEPRGLHGSCLPQVLVWSTWILFYFWDTFFIEGDCLWWYVQWQSVMGCSSSVTGRAVNPDPHLISLLDPYPVRIQERKMEEKSETLT